MTIVKRCGRCGEKKPLDEFPPDRNRYDGRQSWCHGCHALYSRDRHREMMTEYRSGDFKRCGRCREEKPVEEFHRSAGTRDGRHHWCKSCRMKREPWFFWDALSAGTRGDEPWRKDAACRGKGPSMFFSDEPADIEAARKMCGLCPVREPCLEAGLKEWGGIWGGKDPTQRRTEKRRRRRQGAA